MCTFLSSKMDQRYAVVEFPEKSCCDCIPTNRLVKNNKFCMYPEVAGFRMSKLVRNRVSPFNEHGEVDSKLWKECEVRVLTFTGKLL